MPTNRFNYSDDFVLNNGKVGINSASPQEKLDVVGVTKADNLSVVGVSSLTGYEGFLRANHNVAESTSLEGGQGTTGSLSGEIVIGTGVTVTGVTTATSGQGYIDTLKVYNTFTVPVGLTTDRPTAPKPGQLYYNRDFASIEFYDGDRWRQVDNVRTGGRGVFGGDVNSVIDFINISTTGNAQDFGTMTLNLSNVSGCSSNIRGIFGGGTGPYTNNIDYITIASQGNAITFGTLSTANRGYVSACSSSTRGVFGGGYTTSPANAMVNVIDYIHFSTLGNALDFGDLFTGRYSTASLSSPTRGIWAGGAPGITSTIDAITIASTGNAVFFGDLTEKRNGANGCSSSTRGVIGGGRTPVTTMNTIDYITISSFGNAITFGSLTQARQRPASCSSSIRGVWSGGGTTPGSRYNIIDYVTIASTGNASDFGDLTVARFTMGGLSDSHGGLGGF